MKNPSNRVLNAVSLISSCSYSWQWPQHHILRKNAVVSNRIQQLSSSQGWLVMSSNYHWRLGWGNKCLLYFLMYTGSHCNLEIKKESLPSLKLTAFSPLKIGFPNRKIVIIPTIHFEGLLLLVSGRVLKKNLCKNWSFQNQNLNLSGHLGGDSLLKITTCLKVSIYSAGFGPIFLFIAWWWTRPIVIYRSNCLNNL